ncbi:MAG: hypothetical protein KKA84_00155 [Bacteroidetes bacterium]|nr:hypothetical protein [Bacteroidota bacterium]
MKKGCLSIIMMSIFIIGVGYYLWTRFGDDIERKAKERLVEIAVDNLNERVAGLDFQMPPDSLTTHIKNYLEDKFDKVDVVSIRTFLDKFITDLEMEIANSDLESFDFSKLDEFIKNYEK